ncbi:MAG: Gfo/Idh/MocA family oxidoreductase [Gemmataceae bacterium]
MSRNLSRRRVLQLGSLGTLGYFFTGSATSVVKAYGAADRLRVAGVGVGGKGSGDIEQAGKFMDVVGLCDIDDGRLGKRAESWPSAKKYNDFRKLIDEMAREIDAVVVSTPDHHHAPAAMRAMAAGKHVYVQKPLTHTPTEARKMREMAAKMKVCTQMGNQGSALNGLRRAAELVQSGILGNVKEVHVWTNRPFKYWKQAPDLVSRPKEANVPKTVHWNEWLGAAPERPYAVNKDGKPAYHPHDWRGYWDFGTGALGDMACHTSNMAFRALSLTDPIAVNAEAGKINPETYPAWATIHYHFPKRGDKVACTLHWYEGAKDGMRVLPPEHLFKGLLKPNEKLSDSGSMLIGDKGVLFSPNDYGAQFWLYPKDKFEGVQTKKPESGPMGVDGDVDVQMKKEWTDAIKAGKPELASSNFDFSARLTETMLLGNIAVRFAGERLEWDAANMKFSNNASASKLVSKEYRKGWELPTV